MERSYGTPPTLFHHHKATTASLLYIPSTSTSSLSRGFYTGWPRCSRRLQRGAHGSEARIRRWVRLPVRNVGGRSKRYVHKIARALRGRLNLIYTYYIYVCVCVCNRSAIKNGHVATVEREGVVPSVLTVKSSHREWCIHPLTRARSEPVTTLAPPQLRERSPQIQRKTPPTPNRAREPGRETQQRPPRSDRANRATTLCGVVPCHDFARLGPRSLWGVGHQFTHHPQ